MTTEINLENDIPFDKTKIAEAGGTGNLDDNLLLESYLENNQGDDPEQEQTEQAEPEIEPSLGEQNAIMASSVFLGFLSKTIGFVTGTDIQYSENEIVKFAHDSKPFLDKYGDKLPLWLEKYSAEIGALSAVGMITGSTIRQVKAQKNEKAVNKEPAKPEPEKDAA